MSDFSFLHKLNSNEDPLSLDGAVQVKAFFQPLYTSGRSDWGSDIKKCCVYRYMLVWETTALKASEEPIKAALQKQLEFLKVLESYTLHGLMFHSCFIFRE